jgi:SNF2 family DNA or RNA helicase
VIRTKLRGYQREAVEAALPHRGFAFFPEQRTGKCLCSLAVVDHHKPDVLLIIAPKKAILTWETEIDLHIDVDWDCEIYMVTYGELVKNLALRKQWYKYSKDLVDHGGTLMIIVDEAHMIKKPGTAQSKVVRTLGKRGTWNLALTGTPFDKGYEQLWAVFDFIQNKQIFGIYETFKDRYCVYEQRSGKVKKWLELVGYQNTEEIDAAIADYTYRITFNEARRSMGEKPVRIYRKKEFFNLDEKSRDLYNELEAELEVTIDNFEEGQITVEADLPITLIQKLQQICGGFLLHQIRIPGHKKRRRIVVKTGNEKLELLMDVCSGIPDEKVVICCRYRHEIAAIRELFDEFNWTYKEVSGSSEWDGVFDTDFVILQVRSGLGFDLSEAATIVFFSWDHSYITFEQSRFRIMNMETTTKVKYIFLIARDTIEEEYYEAISRKKEFAGLVLDRKDRKREAADGDHKKRIRQARKRAAV